MRVHAQPQEAPAKVGKAKAVPGKEQEAKEIHGSTSRMAPPGHEGNKPGPEAEVHTKVGWGCTIGDTVVSWLPKHLHCACKPCMKASMLAALSKACSPACHADS